METLHTYLEELGKARGRRAPSGMGAMFHLPDVKQGTLFGGHTPAAGEGPGSHGGKGHVRKIERGPRAGQMAFMYGEDPTPHAPAATPTLHEHLSGTPPAPEAPAPAPPAAPVGMSDHEADRHKESLASAMAQHAYNTTQQAEHANQHAHFLTRQHYGEAARHAEAAKQHEHLAQGAAEQAGEAERALRGAGIDPHSPPSGSRMYGSHHPELQALEGKHGKQFLYDHPKGAWALQDKASNAISKWHPNSDYDAAQHEATAHLGAQQPAEQPSLHEHLNAPPQEAAPPPPAAPAGEQPIPGHHPGHVAHFVEQANKRPQLRDALIRRYDEMASGHHPMPAMEDGQKLSEASAQEAARQLRAQSGGTARASSPGIAADPEMQRRTQQAQAKLEAARAHLAQQQPGSMRHRQAKADVARLGQVAQKAAEPTGPTDQYGRALSAYDAARRAAQPAPADGKPPLNTALSDEGRSMVAGQKAMYKENVQKEKYWQKQHEQHRSVMPEAFGRSDERMAEAQRKHDELHRRHPDVEAAKDPTMHEEAPPLKDRTEPLTPDQRQMISDNLGIMRDKHKDIEGRLRKEKDYLGYDEHKELHAQRRQLAHRIAQHEHSLKTAPVPADTPDAESNIAQMREKYETPETFSNGLTPDHYREKSADDDEKTLKDPSTPQDVLHHLATRYRWNAEHAVKNPNLHPTTLRELSENGTSYEDKVHAGIARHKNTDPDVLEHYSHQRNSAIQKGVARNPKATAQMLQNIDLNQPGMDVKEALAAHPNIKPEHLASLVAMHHSGEAKATKMHVAAAGNPQANEETQARLAYHPARAVKQALAKRKGPIAPQALQNLLRDNDTATHDTLLDRPDLSHETVRNLARHVHPAVAEKAQARLDSEAAAEKAEYERNRAANRAHKSMSAPAPSLGAYLATGGPARMALYRE